MENETELLRAIEAGDCGRALAIVEERPEAARARTEDGLSALLLALYHGQADVASAIKALRADLDVFEAAALGDADELRKLLDRDPARASAWSPDGFTPLHYAAFFGRPDAARALLDAGADLEAPARNRELAPRARPLHSAAAGRKLDVCELLLQAGADPNARQHGGYTPLLEAAQQGNAELAELLLRYGADPRARLPDGRSAADLAGATGAGSLAERLGSA